jgi:hypothetical protein
MDVLIPWITQLIFYNHIIIERDLHFREITLTEGLRHTFDLVAHFQLILILILFLLVVHSRPMLVPVNVIELPQLVSGDDACLIVVGPTNVLCIVPTNDAFCLRDCIVGNSLFYIA